MADLDLIIAQLVSADELSEGLGAAEPLLIGELRNALKDAMVCAYRLRLARQLAAGGVGAAVED